MTKPVSPTIYLAQPVNPRRVSNIFLRPGLVLGAFLAFALPGRGAGELRTVSAIRALSVGQTKENLPVRLQGVVTFFDQRLYSYFIQDATAGIYLQFPDNFPVPELSPGQTVEVEGVTSPGEYAPVVAVAAIHATGSAPLPEAVPTTYEQLASGAEDSQFIEITGVVHAARLLPESGHYQVDLATGGGRLRAFAKVLPVAQPEDLVDGVIRVRGVCSSRFNRNRQLFAISVMIPRPDDLAITEPARGGSGSAEARPIGSLLQFSPRQDYGHRVKIVGTVTSLAPGESAYMEDGEQGVKVLTTGTNSLVVGDRAEALGFVRRGEYTPVLEDAVLRKTASGPPPSPFDLTPDEALKGNHDCRLVRVTGIVLDRAQSGGERRLILQNGPQIFQAALKAAPTDAVFDGLQNGGAVAVTGICEIDPGEWQAGPAWRAKSFLVRLRTESDLEVLRAAPWWTLRRVLWVAGGCGLAALAAFGWVAVLHRQVAERTKQLEVQIQGRQLAERRRVIEQERARVAHDLHDELGAGLTEVNMLSFLAKSPATSQDEKKKYLDSLGDTAGRMVTSLDEIVWAVNPRNDTVASLASYFGSYSQRLLDLAGIACGLDVQEDLPDHPLDPRFRQEIFFAFKEALNNIVRHSKAAQVWLRIAVRDARLVVELADNGRGFPTAQPGSGAGADGLANMRERLAKLGGSCTMTPTPGGGATVQFDAPLPLNIK